jgi:hypothetical protein
MTELAALRKSNSPAVWREKCLTTPDDDRLARALVGMVMGCRCCFDHK